MTYANAATKGLTNAEGDMYRFFQDQVANLVQVNGGDHYFNWKTFEYFDSNCPHPVENYAAIYSHSTWKNVSSFSESVCGIYVSLSELADGREHPYNMELVIPYTNLLKYQAFMLYPNAICGEIKELVETSTEALVWAPISPSVVKDALEAWNGDVMSIKLPDYYGITNKFTQCGNAARIISSINKSTSNDDITVKCIIGLYLFKIIVFF